MMMFEAQVTALGRLPANATALVCVLLVILFKMIVLGKIMYRKIKLNCVLTSIAVLGLIGIVSYFEVLQLTSTLWLLTFKRSRDMIVSPNMCRDC
jgi:hypothetical protein